MYHNFIFIEDDGTKHFLKMNPSSISFDAPLKTTTKFLDGNPKLVYKYLTSRSGKFEWAYAPRQREAWYDSVAGLANTKGTLYTNKMPFIATQKNLFTNSDFKPLDWTNTGTIVQFGNKLSPDNLVYAVGFATSPSSTISPVLSPRTDSFVFGYNTVFSMYYYPVLQSTLGLRLRSSSGNTYDAVFNVPTSNDITNDSRTTATKGDFVKTGVGNWARYYVYLDCIANNEVGNVLTPEVVMDYDWVSGVSGGGYFYGVQVEHDTDVPSWYLRTETASVSTPITIEFGDLETSVLSTSGFVKHKLVLPFLTNKGWL